MNALAQLFSSQTKAEVFRLLFGVIANDLHVRELERQTGFGVSTVRYELKKLVEMGIVTVRRDGNRTYYRANVGHPLYPEIRGLVLKTCGLVDVLRRRLIDSPIRLAFVFGSLAAGAGSSQSDIDLMVIGSAGFRDVVKLLSGCSNELGREVNPHVFSPKEFNARRKRREHFISTVLRSPRLFVIGDEDELGAMG